MEQLDKILKAIAALSTTAGELGVPVVGIVGKLIPVFNEIVDEVAARKGVTRDVVIADTHLDLGEELKALLASAARGE